MEYHIPVIGESAGESSEIPTPSLPQFPFLSFVICHLSFVICHLSLVIGHLSLVIGP